MSGASNVIEELYSVYAILCYAMLYFVLWYASHHGKEGRSDDRITDHRSNGTYIPYSTVRTSVRKSESPKVRKSESPKTNKYWRITITQICGFFNTMRYGKTVSYALKTKNRKLKFFGGNLTEKLKYYAR
jgi:hypothetical protein